MSNLIKSVYFNVDPSKVRVIDSDEKVEEYIPTIYDTPDRPELYEFSSFGSDLPQEEEVDFSDGMPTIISMQDVVDEEREKLIREMQMEQESELNAVKDEIISTAKAEADEILAQAAQEAESIREEAHEQGFLAGKEEGVSVMENELAQMRQHLQAEYEAKFMELEEQEKNLEPAFAELIVNLVRKLTGVVCENKKDVILYLIGNTLKNKEKTGQIIIRVSKEDMPRVSSKQSTFKLIAGDVSEFEIVEDSSLTTNECIIETDNKIIDCSLDVQLQNLEEHVKMLVF